MTRGKLLSVLIVAFILAALIRTFVAEGFIVSGDSMAPTILSGDYIFINKLAYISSEPKRSDVIVASPRDEKFLIIKRIIGLPGERFSIENDHVTIRATRLDEGVVLDESYLGNPTTTGNTVVNVDPNEYFALGDNRAVSADSRELGPIDRWQIKGKVFGIIRFSPLMYIGL